ncbi:unnamed protein product [Fraxinus pennsylvanica]|uniref:Uncharacterized protein n=1 Tax=Fraxinus pennsylvanica TaxID=56036 RepID=A0AAD2EAU1_9LAMI|nr:unnamed protein product [Fraxinus pennsylvanica]
MFQDEDIYTFFEPELPSGPTPTPRAKMVKSVNRTVTNLSAGTSGLVSFNHKPPISYRTSEKRASNHTNGKWWSRMLNRMTMHEGSLVLDLKADNYFSCASLENVVKRMAKT